MVHSSPKEAWVAHIQDLLAAPRQRLQQYVVSWWVDNPRSLAYNDNMAIEPAPDVINIVNGSYKDTRWRGCDRSDLLFTEWNMNKIFPLWLWRLNRCNLQRLQADARFTQEPAHSKTDNWSSIFGRLSTRRATHRVSQLQYFLERWEQSYARGLPIFHFGIDPGGTDWMLEPLINNRKIFKHQRIATSCITNISLKYEGGIDTLFVSLLMRANQWSHTYGDIFGASYIGIALCRETGISNLQMGIFMPSSVADEKSTMKAILNCYS